MVLFPQVNIWYRENFEEQREGFIRSLEGCEDILDSGIFDNNNLTQQLYTSVRNQFGEEFFLSDRYGLQYHFFDSMSKGPMRNILLALHHANIDHELMMHLNLQQRIALLKGIGYAGRKWTFGTVQDLFHDRGTIDILNQLLKAGDYYGSLDTRIKQPRRRIHMPTHTTNNSVSEQFRRGNDFDFISYLSLNQGELDQFDLDRSNHSNIQKRIGDNYNRLGYEVWYEVGIFNATYRELGRVDVVAVREDEVILVEVKSSTDFSVHEKSIENLQRSALFFYYNFGVPAKLLLCIGNEAQALHIPAPGGNIYKAGIFR